MYGFLNELELEAFTRVFYRNKKLNKLYIFDANYSVTIIEFSKKMSWRNQKGDKMEYRYKNIYLGETIEEIFPELNNSNTEYECSIFVLLYRPYENIEVYIYLEFGKVRLIKIFDENFQIDNTLKVGIALTDEIINRYDLYYDDFEEVYLSKKHKELVVIVDLADNIIGFSFHLELVGDEAFARDRIKKLFRM